jgi:hypothetical protein
MPREAIYCALLSGISAAILCQVFFLVFKPWLNRVSNLPDRGRGFLDTSQDLLKASRLASLFLLLRAR